ncbi:hypothetical protein ACWD6P_19780 [Streptomyces sp. NPDC002446]
MSRATLIATNLAVAVSATAVGCMLVVTLAPARPDAATGGPPAAGALAAATGHEGSSARAATSALGAGAARPGTDLPTAPVTGRIEVTAPQAGVDFQPNGSFAVAWRNSTGEQVDVWLRTATGHGRSQRLGLVATQAGAGAAAEAIVTLPPVAPGPRYFLEVATAGDGEVRGFSRTFAVTGA